MRERGREGEGERRKREGERESVRESFLNETMHPSIPLSLRVETDSISF